MPTAWPVQKAVSGEEWPICPVNTHLTFGHGGGLWGDARPLAEPRRSGSPHPPPTQVRLALLTPLLAPLAGT